MKKKFISILTTSILTLCGTAPIALLSSCGEKVPFEAHVVADPNTQFSYVYTSEEGNKDKAEFSLNLDKFIGSETINISIQSAQDSAGTEVDFIQIKSGAQTTVSKGDKNVKFEVGFSSDDKLSVIDKYTFTIKVIISRDNDKTEQILDNFGLDVVIPTLESDFIINEKVLSGFQGTHYNECTLFLLPKNIESIADNAFYDGETSKTKIPSKMKLMELDPTGGVSPTLKTIGANAFRKTPFTRNCVIPEGVTSIGGHAFHTAHFTGNIILPKSLTILGNSVFRYITSNKNGCLIVPDDSQLESMGEAVFMQNNLSGKVFIPNTCKSMRQQCFDGAIYLEEVSIPPNLELHNKDFNAVSSLRRIDLSRIDSIEDRMFTQTPTSLFASSFSAVDNVTIVLRSCLQEYEQKIKEHLVELKIPEEKIVLEYVDEPTTNN